MRLFRGRGKAKQREAKPIGSQKVISYYTASRRQLDNFERNTTWPNEAKRRMPWQGWQKSGFHLIFGFVVILMVLYLATLSTEPQIIINGYSYRAISDYKKEIAKTFSGSILYRFKPTLPQSRLSAVLRAKIPEADDVEVSSSWLGHRPNVVITTHPPLALFSQSNGVDYVINNRGRLLLPITQSKTLPGLPIMQNLTGLTGEAGQQFLRPDEAVSLEKLIYQYKTADGEKVIVYTLSMSPHELLVRESGVSYDIKYLLSDDIVQQYGAVKAVQKKLNDLNQKPGVYIDARLADKVYYK